MEKDIHNRKNNVILLIKKWVHNHRQAKNPMIRIIVNLAYAISNTKNVLFNKQCRDLFLIKLFKSERIHQTTPVTGYNRYPVIFNACRNYFEGNGTIKILSFGCSTGEEVVTLRHYFPDATIIGAEINKSSLESCKNRKLDDKITFINSTDGNIKENGPYDAIFCMAVFQRTPQMVKERGLKSLKRIYPFEKFNKQIQKLDASLKDEGLMIVHFSQYDFMDTDVASTYDILGDYNQDLYSFNSAIFDKNSQLITNKQRRYSIFVKRH